MRDIDFSMYSRLPTLPTVAIEAVKLFYDANCSNEQLVAVIRKDPAIVARLLKAANSCRYGNRIQLTDVTRAVSMMGRATTASLVLSFSLARQSMESSEYYEYFRGFWLRAFVQATAAEVLASQLGSPAFQGECYTTNLLAGLGKLALLRAEPEKYVEILRTAAGRKASLTHIEEEVLGFTHCTLSSVLLKQMGFPARCHNAIRAVSDPSITDSDVDGERFPLVRVTRVANAMASLICDDTAAVAVVAFRQAIHELELPNGISSEQLLDQVQQRVEASKEIFDINPLKMPSAVDLLEDAMDQLVRYAMMVNGEADNSAVPAELLEENGRLKRRVADLLFASQMDALTGVCNRAFFLQQFHDQISRHRTLGQTLGLAVVDIDHFKKINDTYGHQAGDEALKLISQTLNAMKREKDVVGRYGGEEFVVLLEDSSLKGMAIIGERIRSGIEKAVLLFEGQQILIKASIGLAAGVVKGTDEEFGITLFALADRAMYRAKNSGRNCFVVEEMDDNRTTIESPAAMIATPA